MSHTPRRYAANDVSADAYSLSTKPTVVFRHHTGEGTKGHRHKQVEESEDVNVGLDNGALELRRAQRWSCP